MAAACRERGEFITGPQVAAFENAFAARLGGGHAIAAAFGRAAFLFVLEALQLPAGTEVILPALTFWAMPEMVRAARLRVRFADVDPATGGLSPAAIERVLSPRSGVVVAAHLHGLPCDLDGILDVAARRRLVVIEDCADALGAAYRGRPVGTFGDAAIFSFDTFAPLNCGGGGMAVVRDGAVAARVRRRVESLPWPHEKRVTNRLLLGRLQDRFTRPPLFALAALPALWLTGRLGLPAMMWPQGGARQLDPLPDEYLERFSNVQAALGLASLDMVDAWTAATRKHAHALNAALAGVSGLELPTEPPDRTHVYHRYALRVEHRRAFVKACFARGVEVEGSWAEICPGADLAHPGAGDPVPGAERAAEAVLVPVHASLTDLQTRRVAKVVRTVLGAPGADPSTTTTTPAAPAGPDPRQQP